MNIAQIIATQESHGDSGDHEFRGETHTDNYGPEDVTEDDQLTTPVEAAEAVVELDGQVDDIEATDAAVSDAESAVEVIDDAIAEATAQDESGRPVSDTQVQLMEITHESIMYRLGLVGNFPTMESMQYSDRARNLIATMESEKRSLLQKIGAAIKAAAQQVMEFITGLVRNAWLLGKYLDYIQKKVKALPKDAKPGASQMKASAKAMSVNGTANFQSVGPLAHGAVELLTRATKAAESLAASNFKFGDIETSVVVADYVPSGAALVGGRSITGTTKLLVTDTIYEIKAGEVATDAVALNPGQMNEALVSAGKIVTAMKAFDAANGRVKRFLSNFTQYLAHLGAEVAGSVNQGAKEKSREMSYIRGYRLLLSKVIGKFPLEAFKTAKAIIDYVRNSLRQYSQAGKVDEVPAANAA